MIAVSIRSVARLPAKSKPVSLKLAPFTVHRCYSGSRKQVHTKHAIVQYESLNGYATNMTLPVEEGFGYLVAIMDWYSRKVLSWRLSNTLGADFCVQALEAAIQDYGCPQIMNTVSNFSLFLKISQARGTF